MTFEEFDPKTYVDKEAAWLAFRRIWLRENPPLDNGYYISGISGNWVKAEDVSLDHINGRDGDLMFDPNNIQPCSGYENYLKGSKRWKPKVGKDEYDFLRIMNEM